MAGSIATTTRLSAGMLSRGIRCLSMLSRSASPDPQWLYDQLPSHTGELAIVGVAGDCGGAVDSLLAGLAWRRGRPDEAAARAQAGLALETRVGSQIWINRTRDLIGRITAAPG
jgi:hypothetical protein